MTSASHAAAGAGAPRSITTPSPSLKAVSGLCKLLSALILRSHALALLRAAAEKTSQQMQGDKFSHVLPVPQALGSPAAPSLPDVA